MSSAEIFREITAALDQARIPYMVVGSFASNLYGTGRGTQDIDLVVSATQDQIRVLLGLLPQTTYYFNLDAALEALRRKDMFNILDMKRGWKIDLIFEKSSAYHQQAFQRRTLEWAKLGESSRQIEDVAGVLKVQEEQIDRTYIEKWVKELGLAAEWARARKLAGLD